jgi:hypothetical protein
MDNRDPVRAATELCKRLALDMGHWAMWYAQDPGNADAARRHHVAQKALFEAIDELAAARAAISTPRRGDRAVNSIICRGDTDMDDFHALKTAQAIEDCGATVISISYRGHEHPFGAMVPSARYNVFARFDPSITSFDQIDEAIEKVRFPQKG